MSTTTTAKPTAPSAFSSPRDEAIRTLCSNYFHRALWLPETAEHPKLRVTYSTTDNFDNASLPVILFVGPMFCSRWSAVELSKLARDCGVRVISTDRPAMGGSTPVALNMRMNVWLETIPVLLQKLGIKHVSLMTHSAGAIYTLNTLLHHRNILDPESPSVVFLAPYVSWTVSGATLPTSLSKLPTGMLNSFGDLMGFINTKVMPSASWSGGIFSSAVSVFSSSASTDIPGSEASTSMTSAERYGVDEQTAKAIDDLHVKYKFAECTAGVNDDAKLCLRKCEDADLGEARDYQACIRSIAQNERTLQEQNPGTAKLKVEAFFGGSDIMIGKRGQEYFERCWQQDDVKQSVDFTTKTYPEANHDSVIIDYKKGALIDVFENVALSRRNSTR